jgi:hypothetical protein
LDAGGDINGDSIGDVVVSSGGTVTVFNGLASSSAWPVGTNLKNSSITGLCNFVTTNNPNVEIKIFHVQFKMDIFVCFCRHLNLWCRRVFDKFKYFYHGVRKIF